MSDIENQANTDGILVQDESGILGEMVNLSNSLYQDTNADPEREYQERNSIIYKVPSHLPPQSSESDDDDNSIVSYTPGDVGSSIKKTRSIVSTGPSLTKVRTRYFSPRLQKQRRKVILHFFGTLGVFIVFIFTIFPLFWGSNAFTYKYFSKVKVLGVLQDESYTPEMMASSVVPLTAAVDQIIPMIPGKWSVFNTSSFNDLYKTTNSTQIDKKVTERIYHEYYWLAINVRPNATEKLWNSLVNASAPPFNSTELFEVTYESGRDPSNVKGVVLPIMQSLETAFAKYYTTQYFPSLLANVTSAYPNITFNPENLAAAGSMKFGYNDYRPFFRRGLITSSQIGAVYALVLTAFQFLVYAPLHMEMSQMLTVRQYIAYRVLISFVSLFFISLFFSTVSAMFGFDFTIAFGRGGFVIYWMTTWLFMMACAGANENMVSLIFLWKPHFLGFWVLSFVIINLGPSLFPMALDNVFYRYGYAMPIHNAVDIYRVIMMDLSRRHMGRNFGILVAWIVLNTVALPFVIMFGARVNKKRQMAAAAAAAEAEANGEPAPKGKASLM